MEPTAIEPSNWTAVLATLAGAASLIILGVVPVIIVWLKNLRASAEIQNALLQQQLEELKRNTTVTKQVEAQTNGQLAAARNEAQKWRLTAERAQRVIASVNASEQGRALLNNALQAMDYDDLQRRLMGEAHQEPRP